MRLGEKEGSACATRVLYDYSNTGNLRPSLDLGCCGTIPACPSIGHQHLAHRIVPAWVGAAGLSCALRNCRPLSSQVSNAMALSFVLPSAKASLAQPLHREAPKTRQPFNSASTVAGVAAAAAVVTAGARRRNAALGHVGSQRPG